MTHQPGERDRPQADLAAGFAEQPLRHFVLSERCNALGVDAPDSDSSHHTPSEMQGFAGKPIPSSPPTLGTCRPMKAVACRPSVNFSPVSSCSRSRYWSPAVWTLVEDHRETQQLLEGLDPGTTAVSSLREGRAIGATDFRLHEHGMTRILLVDGGLYKHEIGPMVVRLMELETYRTMALLGLPEARALQPSLSRAEAGLQEVTTKIGSTSDITENRALLDSLTTLAGELEAASARSAFRFGATRAYNEIVQMRLASITETPLEGYTRWGAFLQRRMAPAIRTGERTETRQSEISDRLARAANLLRTRIEVDLEQQNRELLASMNRRARLRLRLQQWVEGLSVAAVSYYVVSLIYYLAQGADSYGLGIESARVTAFAVPVIVVAIWLFVRSIRARGHAAEAKENDEHS